MAIPFTSPVTGGSNFTDMDFLDAVVRAELQLMADEQPDLQKYRQWYEGEQTLAFGTEKFKLQFGTAFEGFKDNWCGVVADALVDKLEVIGLEFPSTDIDSSNPAASPTNPLTDQIWDAFQHNDFNEQQQEIHEGAVVEGRSAVIVWPDPELGARIDWQPAQTVRVRYSDDDRRKPVLAVKRWQTPSGEIRVNVYTDRALFKFTETSNAFGGTRNPALNPTQATLPTSTSSHSLRRREVSGESWPLLHNFGEVPVVEIYNPKGSSEIRDIIPQQDAMNFLLMAGLGMAEESVLPPRGFFTGASEPAGGWKMGAGQFWVIPPILDADGRAIASSQFEFGTGDLDQLRNFTDSLLMHMAFTSRTPLRYFFQSDRGGRGDAPSGESLLVTDEQLIGKVDKFTVRAGNAYYRLARLVGKAITRQPTIDLPPGIVVWKDPRAQYRSAVLADGVQMLALGMPFEFIITTLGLSPDEIEMVKTMRKAEQEEQRVMQKEDMGMQAELAAANRPPSSPSSPSSPDRE